MINLDEIKMRLEAATPGDWILVDKGYDLEFPTTVDFSRVMAKHENVYTNVVMARLGAPDKICIEKHNAEFITNSKKDITNLLELVEAQERAIALVQDWAERGLIDGYPELDDQIEAILQKGKE